VVVMLGIASLLLVYSSIVTLAFRYHQGNTIYYLVRHGGFVITGLIIIYLIHNIKYTYFSRIAQLALWMSVPLLIITLLLGTNINDASRWLRIPVINQSFQTSDFAKLALVMYVARMLSHKQDDIKNFKKTFIPIVLPVIIICGLIFPANLSTAAVLFISCIVLMFIGRVSVKHILALIGTGIVLIALVLLVANSFPKIFPRTSTWVNRIENFRDPENTGNYQVEQSKIAIATGGLYGKGPGNSNQRNFLPHPYSDFIYSIVIEEYGLIGGFFIIVLYLILLYRSVRIVIKCKRTFGSLLVAGLAFSLVFQAIINMAVASDLMPVTGQPLPMVSMGGTSIWFTSIAIGIILSVSRSIEADKRVKLKTNEEL